MKPPPSAPRPAPEWLGGFGLGDKVGGSPARGTFPAAWLVDALLAEMEDIAHTVCDAP